MLTNWRCWSLILRVAFSADAEMRELAIPAVNSRSVLLASFVLEFSMMPKMLTQAPDPLLSRFEHRMVFGAILLRY
jgi:hypothetical protein